MPRWTRCSRRKTEHVDGPQPVEQDQNAGGSDICGQVVTTRRGGHACRRDVHGFVVVRAHETFGSSSSDHPGSSSDKVCPKPLIRRNARNCHGCIGCNIAHFW